MISPGTNKKKTPHGCLGYLVSMGVQGQNVGDDVVGKGVCGQSNGVLSDLGRVKQRIFR